MSSQQMQQYPKSTSTVFDFDLGDDSDNEQVYFDAAFGAIGGTGTVGTFGVVRGNRGKLRGLLVLVIFCCLFEEERVNTGINVGTMLERC